MKQRGGNRASHYPANECAPNEYPAYERQSTPAFPTHLTWTLSGRPIHAGFIPLSPIDRVSAPPAIVDLNSLPPIQCPCGVARRAFSDRDEFPGTVHLTQIQEDARDHYHREHTEVYVVLECEADAAIELDGKRHPVAPRTAVLIPPGVRHRACGRMTVLILCSPNFDPADEHF